jgi:hypothetical protein
MLVSHSLTLWAASRHHSRSGAGTGGNLTTTMDLNAARSLGRKTFTLLELTLRGPTGFAEVPDVQ